MLFDRGFKAIDRLSRFNSRGWTVRVGHDSPVDVAARRLVCVLFTILNYCIVTQIGKFGREAFRD